MQPRVRIAEVLDVPGAREAGISAAHASLRLLERRASILRMMAAYLAGMHLLAFQMRTTTWGTTTPTIFATGRAQRRERDQADAQELNPQHDSTSCTTVRVLEHKILALSVRRLANFMKTS